MRSSTDDPKHIRICINANPHCMYMTPSGCPLAEQFAAPDWSPWPDPSVLSEAACDGQTEALAGCGVTDGMLKWVEGDGSCDADDCCVVTVRARPGAVKRP
jgi:hypothetical protein